MGGQERSDGVGILVAEKLVDSVVNVERHSKRVPNLRMVLDNGLLNVLTVYAPHSGKPEEEKESFWNDVFHLVVLAGDMNGHVGCSNVGYDGTHGGFEYGDKMADGSRILEFADGLNLGPVAPISVNFNHQLSYFADQSDTTHVPHQPTAVA